VIRGNQLAHRASYDRRARMATPHDVSCKCSLPYAEADPGRRETQGRVSQVTALASGVLPDCRYGGALAVRPGYWSV